MSEQRWIQVAKVGDVREGDLIPVEADGRQLALFLDSGRYGCVQRKCLHQGGDLSQGIVSRNHIVCPQHGWRFSTVTGVHAESPETCLAMFDVRVVDDRIEVDPTPRRHG